MKKITDSDISRYSSQVDSIAEKVTELEAILRELEEWAGELGMPELFLPPLSLFFLLSLFVTPDLWGCLESMLMVLTSRGQSSQIDELYKEIRFEEYVSFVESNISLFSYQ